jgi:hypothetical protein
MVLSTTKPKCQSANDTATSEECGEIKAVANNQINTFASVQRKSMTNKMGATRMGKDS